MYEQLGRMMGRSYEETVLTKGLRSLEKRGLRQGAGPPPSLPPSLTLP
jgi:hypothetical protein